MPQFQTYPEDTPTATDKFLFHKNSANQIKSVTLTNLATIIKNLIASFFTSSTVVPSTTPSAGQILVGNVASTAYAKQSVTGDVTISSTGVTTIGSGAVSYAKLQDVSVAGRLLGRGGAAGAGDTEEIQLGTGLSMSGTTLNATAGTGNVSSASDFGTDNVLIRSDSTAKNVQATGIEVDDDDNVVIPGDVTSESLITPVIVLDATHAADDTYHGFGISGYNAGATIAQWEAVYMGAASKWLLADADGVGAFPARGLAVAAYADTNPAIILTKGSVRNDAWAWTIGGQIYLSATAGALTQTPPAVSGDAVQRVGYALTADIAFFDFGNGEHDIA